jgi:hypothetical protein
VLPFTKEFIITSYFETRLDPQQNTLELLPFGHSRHFPLKFNIADKRILSGESNFFNAALYKNFKEDNFIAADKCSVTLNPSKDKLIVLNCLDNCFGHALLKLFYAADYSEKRKEEFDVLWIVPKAMQHFLKESPGRNFLVVHASFAELEKCFVLNKEIDKIASNYKEVYLAGTETYADFDTNILTRQLQLFKNTESAAIRNKVVFYYRADYYRMWDGKKQGKRIVQLFSGLKNYFDSSIRFCVVGDRDKFVFPSWISDERVTGFSEEHDFNYNALFNSSILCIGFNGSHMLFPSMFSECTIHLHPSHKYKNMAEDTVVSLATNEMFSTYKHLYYFGNYNCSDLSANRLATLILFHYQGLMEKRYKLFERNAISQEVWIKTNYPFFNIRKVNEYRKLFNHQEGKKNRLRYHLDKWFA